MFRFDPVSLLSLRPSVPFDPPRGVDISEALEQIHHRVLEKLGEDRVLEWDAEKETLNIPDPYFLYYMRWAGW